MEPEIIKDVKIYDEEYEISDNDKDPTFLQGLDLIRNNIILCG